MKLAVTLPLSLSLQSWFSETWQRCETELGIDYTARHGSVPHIALSAGGVTEPSPVIDAAAAVAQSARDFSACPVGIGVFATERPVIHLRWAPGGPMRGVFDAVHNGVGTLWEDPAPLTDELYWVPKTTIVGTDTERDMIPRILELVGDTAWQSDVLFDRFLLIDYGDAVEKTVAEIDFGTGRVRDA